MTEKLIYYLLYDRYLIAEVIIKRIYEHKKDKQEGFTKKYQIHQLVYFEKTTDVLSAIQREKQIKKWNREWKLRLIEEFNPEWKDLYLKITGAGFPPPRDS